MKKLLNFYLFLVVVCMYSCTQDIERNLGNDYFIAGYGETSKICKNNTEKGVKEILMGEIADYRVNDRYIIIFRVVSEGAKEYFNDHPYSEIMRGSDTIQYLIIQKQKDSVFGPLDKDEYRLKRKELKIPRDLLLKEEEL